METIELDLDDDELFRLMRLAHEQDITLNQLINNVLQQVVDMHEETYKTAGFDNV
jgi:predicted HicB family RNase H-like nuclease